ncbi:MAG TPA: SpoIID/LytB domain-containing protein [Bacilli bacterium]
MFIMKRPKQLNSFIIAILLLSITIPLFNIHTFAAIPKLNEIRVALFIDLRGTVPSVTLSSSSGIQIGLRQPDGVKNWFIEPIKFRAGIDQYMIQLLESTDYAAAKTLYTKLASTPYQPYLITRSLKDVKMYYVYTGQYSTRADALSTKDKINADLTITALLNKSKVFLTGPLHWNAGTYPTEAAALNQLQVLSQAGLHAQLAYHGNNEGTLVYSVWYGEASDQTDLTALKEQAALLMPDLVLQPIDPNLHYFLKKEDLSLGTSHNDATSHYVINAVGQKAWFSPVESAIKVRERFNRTYRGSFELSQYNNKLAFINVLPFEHYLYGVVGAEMGSGWPIEALKAQAVTARTYALVQGLKYKIAHVSDTTFEQAYYGLSKESQSTINAVDSTAGEVIVNKKGLITPFYYSNSGGMTAEATEAWGNPLDYIQSVPSPDEGAQRGMLVWNRIVLPNGIIGFIRSDYIKNTNEKNAAGLPIFESQSSGINVRPAPHVTGLGDTTNSPLTTVGLGDRVVSFEDSIESNTFRWVRGPYTEQQMRDVINAKTKAAITGKLETLEVIERGPSGRVLKIQANGKDVPVSNPDSFRAAMNGLPSTRFEIEETGRYTVLGANGVKRSYPENKTAQYVMGRSSIPNELVSEKMFFMNSGDEVRLATKEPNYRFIGFGFGHGVGMSQWGARIWAEDHGYNYKQILLYYYKGVNIVKE